MSRERRTIRGVAIALSVAIGCTFGGGSVPLLCKSGKPEAAIAASATADVAKPEIEYWRKAGDGTLYGPQLIAAGKLVTVASNGWINYLDGSGRSLKRLNAYTDLSAPAVNKQGQMYVAGKSARLYLYDSAGVGGQAALYYFSGKTENLQPSKTVTDGGGLPYFAYQNAILSLDKDGAKKAALLPKEVSVTAIVEAGKGVYAIGSNGVLYAVQGEAITWEAALQKPLMGAKLAADRRGGVVLVAPQAVAAYEADGTVRFSRELAAAAAGGWTEPVMATGPDSAETAVAAELSGNAIVAFRADTGAEAWRVSATGAGGFAPAALTLAPAAAAPASAPGASAGVILAGARSGAVYAIDGSAGRVAYTYKGNAALPVSGIAALGGGRIAYASADKLIVAGPYRSVAVTYAAAAISLPLHARLLLTDKLKLSAPVAVSYASGNPAVARIDEKGMITTVSVGSTNISVVVTTEGYKGELKLPIKVTAATLAHKTKHELKIVKVGNQSYSVQTVAIPKGMPVTVGLASRKVGVVQQLSGIAKSYNAEAAINATYFEAYGGIPEPYGTVITEGKVEHIGNTGTAIGFTWDGTVVMDTLRVKILGGTNGSYQSPSNWYAYFVNRTPVAGSTSAIMFTPKRGAKIGFAFGTAVTLRKGIVTKITKNTNADIPSDGYVLVYTGAEEKLANRFKVGTKVEYKISMTNMAGQAISWSRVHTAVAAGPRLVTNGKLTVNPAPEGFSSPRILTDSATRSAILVKKDGSIVLATVGAATIKQWGQIMVALGAQQAMNLDGGASSGLYAQGEIITAPGRLISNALVFGNKLKW
ncbi:phosphodiester glycosidase family protein [Paenibacillus harenae]|uniref:phosphodiester glycosidase family protein n=1 Tax=Paenibacillus harenae TaxID=306543 RepID=UPI00278E6721|nr:phosphodiester glycosidase family protein [Paenibacillus harenae]MDQ0063084.1 exopolysaccharide biosynthesis protein [Paenibacillus harenae]